MYLVYIISAILAATTAASAAVAIPGSGAGNFQLGKKNSSEGQGSHEKQDFAPPICECTAQQILCCSDAGCQNLGDC